MNFTLIGGLIRLRYKLLWAKTRSRNGKIALFFSGYLLLVLLISLVVAGGFGAGIVAVRAGRAEFVARVVLGAVFVQALIASLTLGFGVNNLFSDLELRRYPTRAMERRVVRHAIAIADPFWTLFLMLELGLATGLYVYGGAGFWKGVVAVLLLFLTNYVLARVIGSMVDRLMQRKSGTIILMAVFMSLALGPSILAGSLKDSPGLGAKVVRVLSVTPPFGAAAAMAREGAAAIASLGLVAGWLIGLMAVLVIMEKRPVVRQRTENAKVSWGGWVERVGALFPPEDAPFVAFWLRFYMRNGRFRTMYVLTLPLVGFLIFNFSRRPGGSVFLSALGILPIAGFLATSRMAVNQYGYVGGGFRRFFLLPTGVAASLRAGTYASMILGVWMIPAAVIGWIALARVPFDWRMALMLLASGTTGLFLFHGLGLWVTLFNPRKGDYNNNFGNDLSLGGNIVVIGGVFTCLFFPVLLKKLAPAMVAPEYWWLSLAPPLLAAGFLKASLRAAGPKFRERRERLLAVVEGRN